MSLLLLLCLPHAPTRARTEGVKVEFVRGQERKKKKRTGSDGQKTTGTNKKAKTKKDSFREFKKQTKQNTNEGRSLPSFFEEEEEEEEASNSPQ